MRNDCLFIQTLKLPPNIVKISIKRLKIPKSSNLFVIHWILELNEKLFIKIYPSNAIGQL